MIMYGIKQKSTGLLMGVNIYIPFHEEYTEYEFDDINSTVFLVDSFNKAETALLSSPKYAASVEHPWHSSNMKNNPDDFEVVEVELKF